MPAYYAIGHLSGALFPTIGAHPHAKTPNAAPQPHPEAEAERTL